MAPEMQLQQNRNNPSARSNAMHSFERSESVLEWSHTQAFMPIIATLFFAAVTSPMFIGWRAHESLGLGIVRNGGQSSPPIVVAQCKLPEHQQWDQRCYCTCH
jgi:hypothetical protein